MKDHDDLEEATDPGKCVLPVVDHSLGLVADAIHLKDKLHQGFTVPFLHLMINRSHFYLVEIKFLHVIIETKQRIV